MKLAVHLDHPGASLELEALAGQVLLQLVQPGRPPVTVILSPEAAGQLVDFAGAVATVAQEQQQDLPATHPRASLAARWRARVAPLLELPRELDPAEEPFPAFVGPRQLWEAPTLTVYGLRPPKGGRDA